MEMQTSGGDRQFWFSMPGAYSFDNGKTRLEMNFADVKGSMITPDTVQQMKSMGMDKTVVISRPDLKLTYITFIRGLKQLCPKFLRRMYPAV